MADQALFPYRCVGDAEDVSPDEMQRRYTAMFRDSASPDPV